MKPCSSDGLADAKSRLIDDGSPETYLPILNDIEEILRPLAREWLLHNCGAGCTPAKLQEFLSKMVVVIAQALGAEQDWLAAPTEEDLRLLIAHVTYEACKEHLAEHIAIATKRAALESERRDRL